MRRCGGAREWVWSGRLRFSVSRRKRAQRAGGPFEGRLAWSYSMQETTLDVVAIQPSTEQRIQMAYRHDPDLEFLGKMKSSDLNDLVRCLTHDKDGSARLTEELTM